MYLQMKPKLLPIIFMIIADMAGGNATSGEVKWEVAKTTPKDEFCIPTCENEVLVLNRYKRLSSPSV